MKHLQFISEGPEAEAELVDLGLLHPYIMEEEGRTLIGGYAHGELVPTHSRLHAILPIELDWAAQWAAFAPGYDGTHLEIHGHRIRIDPGPGFGDLSHPTTSLMTSLMRAHVPGRHVVDVGCGSGILSLFAARLGAASITAVDIDPEAVAHTEHNCALNDLKIAGFTNLPPLPNNPLLLINMTRGEQEVLFDTHPNLLDHPAIISGLRVGQRPLHSLARLQLATTEKNWLAYVVN